MIFTQPDNNVEDEMTLPVIMSGGFPASNIQNCKVIDGYVTSDHTYCSLQKTCFHHIKRYVSIGYRDEDGSIVRVGEIQLQNSAEGMGYSGPMSFRITEGRAYNIMGIESVDGKTWMPCQQLDYTCSVVIKLVNGELSMTNTTKLSADVAVDWSIYDTYKIDITTHNLGDKEYYGYVYVYVSKDDNRPDTYYSRKGITVLTGTDNKTSFDYYADEPGKYHVWVYGGVSDPFNYELCHGIFELNHDAPTAIESVPASSPLPLTIVTGKGTLTVGAAAPASVRVVSANGTVMRRLSLCGGESVDVHLPRGVYIVDGKKVSVR